MALKSYTYSDVAGTRVYWAPEQGDRGNRRYDSRADIFSMGVIFFEMLLGGNPIDYECYEHRDDVIDNELTR